MTDEETDIIHECILDLEETVGLLRCYAGGHSLTKGRVRDVAADLRKLIGVQ